MKGGKWVGFYCDSVHFDDEQYIFTVCALLLLYVLYYCHMCYIITVYVILLPYVLFELWWISSIIYCECMCLDRHFFKLCSISLTVT